MERMALAGVVPTASGPARPRPAWARLRDLGRRAAAELRRLTPSPLTVAGLASVDAGAFCGGVVAGWVVTGLSCLVLEWIIGPDDTPGTP